MAVIRLYPRSNLTDPIIIERPCFADWLREMGGLPDGYRIYSGAVAASTDITEQLYENPELMLECNDAGYVTEPVVNGKQIKDPAYRAWSRMLERAYSARFHENNPTYINVTVCNEWHSFRSFRNWWLANYRDGWQIDKDMLSVGNREYGPDLCMYVPQWLNSFTIDCGASRGEFPIGVYLHVKSGKYISMCSNPVTGNKKYLGLFSSPSAAYKAWLQYKLELADQLKAEMDSIDKRIYPNVVTIIKAAV